MKLQLASSLKVAHRVLAKIDLAKTLADEICVDGYENGREHGLHMTVWSPDFSKFMEICWAENRNSDNIVVYVGQPGEYFGDGHVPSEDAWLGATYFDYGNYAAAAKYIKKCIMGALKE